MKKIIQNIIIGFLIILGLPFFILAFSEITGIGKKEGSFKVYEAFSPTKAGQDFINKYKIKCVATDVESIAFIDVSRGEIFFANNIDQNNYFFFEKIKYNRVADEIVTQYQLSAHFTLIETNGKYFVNTIYIICVICWILVWWFGRK